MTPEEPELGLADDVTDARRVVGYLVRPEANDYIAVMDVLEGSVTDLTVAEVVAASTSTVRSTAPRPRGPNSTLTVQVTAQQAVDPWSKAGLVLRNDVSAPGESQGYAVLVVTPGNGVSLQWQDSSTPGYLDQFATSVDKTIKAPVWLRLIRHGDQVSGYYSADGAAWTQVGSAVTLAGATTTQDAGMIATAHSAGARGEADFSDFDVS